MNKSKRSVYLNIISTVVIALCLAVITMFMYHDINNIAKKDCFQTLHNKAESLVNELKYNIDTDEALLVRMSELLEELPDFNGIEARKILSLDYASCLLEEAELLLPDGSTMSEDGWRSDGISGLNYEQEATQGIHFTDKVKSPSNQQQSVIYHVVPVEKHGEVVALLCGRINLENLNKKYLDAIEQDGSRFHVVQGSSREGLVDTIHDTLGVMPDMRDRIVLEEYDAEQAMEDFTEGREGEIAFFSNTLQEYLYCVYIPVGVEDWIAMLGIPESIAFENVTLIRRIFMVCSILEGLALLGYFILLLRRSWRAADELEEQYIRSQDLLKIQEQLFHSVLNTEGMTAALRQAAKLVTAEKVYLLADLHQSGMQIYGTEDDWQQKRGAFKRENYIGLANLLKKEGKVFFKNLDQLDLSDEEKSRMRQENISNGMGIVLKDSRNQYRGSLLAVNMSRKWQEDSLPLEWMQYGFSMALDNLEAFWRIKEIGSKDQLTGLLNRNSYQKAMEFYEKAGEETLNCIYIDVDGLHELNNQLGHTAGDRMLTTISRMLQEIFGEDTVYRIGGDEFLVFCCKLAKNEVEYKCQMLQEKIIDAGYHISLGISTRKEESLVYEMVKLAESRMYEAKRQYYKEQKNGTKVREMNRQLEATLLEKRDLDAFCSVLAYKYTGIYIVNLSLDSTRNINIPAYFLEKLQAAGGKFSRAMQSYIEDFVMDENQEQFKEMFDYEKLYLELSHKENPELVYTRRDGARLLLKIYPTPDFDEFQKECIWTFEIIGEQII